MTDKQYNDLVVRLEKAGYRKHLNNRNPSMLNRCDWCYSKKITHDDRDMYTIWWLVYDRSPYFDREPSLKDNPWGVEIKVYVAHAVEMHLWYRDYTLDEVEQAAKKFYEFATKLKLNDDGKS